MQVPEAVTSRRSVRAFLGTPVDHVFYCGMAIGTRDPEAAVNQFEVSRASIDDAVRFEGF